MNDATIHFDFLMAESSNSPGDPDNKTSVEKPCGPWCMHKQRAAFISSHQLYSLLLKRRSTASVAVPVTAGFTLETTTRAEVVKSVDGELKQSDRKSKDQQGD